MAALGIDDLVAYQADQCARAGSPLYAEVLAAALDDVRDGGPVAQVLAGHAEDQFGSALVLRLLGAVHRIVLEGRAPALAAHYPSVGGRPNPREVGPAFLATVAEHRDEVVRRLADGVQTNEVGRCSVLVGGFAEVANRTGLPLRVLEMGASAGLNLRWDAYAYELGDGRLAGDPSSPVRLDNVWEGPGPVLPARFDVAERRGCDPAPIDPTSHDGQLRLRSYVWPDQIARLRRLEAALELAARVPAVVEEADGTDWVAARLAEPSTGVATVVVHSIVLQYLTRERRAELRSAIALAGSRATGAAPLAWLRFEPGGDMADLRLTLWPGGREQLLARSGFHGAPARWLARD